MHIEHHVFLDALGCLDAYITFFWKFIHSFNLRVAILNKQMNFCLPKVQSSVSMPISRY